MLNTWNLFETTRGKGHLDGVEARIKLALSWHQLNQNDF